MQDAPKSASPGPNRLRASLRWAAHRHPLLLAAARAARDRFFTRKPAPPKWLRGFEPLCIDENRLAEFDAIAPTLRQEILTEFGHISRVLQGKSTGNPFYLWRAEHPFDDMIDGARELNIVYTPGKVGSQTAAATLHAHPSKPLVRFGHFISAKGLHLVESLLERSADRPQAVKVWRDGTFLGRWMRALLAVNRAMRAKGTPGVRKPFFISGLREPLALHVSFIFECAFMYADSPEELTADFVRDRLADDAWQHHCNTWLLNDLGATTGIDVFAQPFPAERGWEIYENEQARVLLIRQESLDALTHALGAMYGWEPSTFKVESMNQAENKSYAEQYNRVKKTLRLTRRELDLIYSVPYVRHFYTPAEIEQFKARWQERTALRMCA